LRGWAAFASGDCGGSAIAGSAPGVAGGCALAMAGGVSGWTEAATGAGVADESPVARGISIVSIAACISFDNWSAKSDAAVGQFVCVAPAGSTDCSDEATEGVGDAAAVDVGSGVMS
jgi:hypothetical protein